MYQSKRLHRCPPMNSDQAPPMDMAPSWRGETRTPACGERILWRPRAVLGSGAGMKMAGGMLDASVRSEKGEEELWRESGASVGGRGRSAVGCW